MKHTKRTRKQNIRRILSWYIREKKISEVDIKAGLPEMDLILNDPGEMDFDDVVRAFDFIGVDLVAVPRVSARGMSKSLEWYCINAIPYDDGGKWPERDAGMINRRRAAKERHERKRLS